MQIHATQQNIDTISPLLIRQFDVELQQFSKANLKPPLSLLFHRETSFLGHVLGKDWVVIDPTKWRYVNTELLEGVAPDRKRKESVP
ncbi:hypothetical protein ANANG_G00048300 [Anguilla anguilla]|uniref:Uncharacterized protein n=1 Tax=Anguilla anguilla TaxID=7936 RepID=A0A9D3MWE7_ANGAN|nr:hypothetical protein ANANG_G00048300 [Anguilla anguilla]